jgi:hypothetical protein
MMLPDIEVDLGRLLFNHIMIVRKDPMKYIALIEQQIALRKAEDNPNYYLGSVLWPFVPFPPLVQGQFDKPVTTTKVFVRSFPMDP